MAKNPPANPGDTGLSPVLANTITVSSTHLVWEKTGLLNKNSHNFTLDQNGGKLIEVGHLHQTDVIHSVDVAIPSVTCKEVSKMGQLDS